MQINDIEKIEKDTGLTLPECYVKAVTNYPVELLSTDAPDFGFLDDPEQIIEENLSVRESGYFGEKWPDRYIIIGHNGCGDYYVVNESSMDLSIGFADHESMECNLYAKNLSEFIEKYLSESQRQI